jgi:hypothetical protein
MNYLQIYSIFVISVILLVVLLPAGTSINQPAIGDRHEGGIIFYLTPNRKHGLIAETKDQGNATWYGAQNLVSDPANHSKAGKKYTDWRVPTMVELNLMYANIGPGARASLKNAGSFANNSYWSSTAYANDSAWYKDFVSGVPYGATTNAPFILVRSVRSF